MTIEELKKLIEQIKLQITILSAQLAKIVGQKVTVPNLDDPNKIIIHHAAGYLDFNGVNEWHKQKWGFKSSLGYYIGYTYFIETSGKVFEGRRDQEEGAHTKGQNLRSIGICLMGDGTKKDFTPEQYQSLAILVDAKRQKYGIEKGRVYPHSAFAPTECPSDYLRNWILKLI